MPSIDYYNIQIKLISVRKNNDLLNTFDSYDY